MFRHSFEPKPEGFWKTPADHECLLDQSPFHGIPYTIPTDDTTKNVEGTVFCSPCCALRYVMMCKYRTETFSWFSHFYLEHYGLMVKHAAPHPRSLKRHGGKYDITMFRSIGAMEVFSVITEEHVYPFEMKPVIMNHLTPVDMRLMGIMRGLSPENIQKVSDFVATLKQDDDQ